MPSLFIWVLLLLAVINNAATASPLLFTFGYLRMGSPDEDSANVLAGYLSTIQYANTHNTVPGVRLQLNMTTVPCWTRAECTNLSSSNAQLVQKFISAMPGFSAVLKPNDILAVAIVDEATRLGGLPVLDAADNRLSSFEGSATHLINFNPSWQRQVAHLFTYMHQTDRCVHSGIVHAENTSDVLEHVNGIRKLFTDGGFPSPPAIDALSATDAHLDRFFMGESRRRCFIVIGTSYLMRTTLTRLLERGFNPKTSSFYGVSTAMGEGWLISGSNAMYANSFFVDWSPLFASSTFDKIFQEWTAVSSAADARRLFTDHEESPTVVSRLALQGYLTVTFLIEAIRDAVARVAAPNTTGPLPLPWTQIVDSFYLGSRIVDGVTLAAPIRACPRAPEKQLCFCNTVTRTSFMFAINTTNDEAYPVYDDESQGQRNIASLAVGDTCGFYASSWSYPTTGLALYPAALMGTEGQRLSDLEDAYQVFQATYSTMTYEANYATTAPTRAMRYAAYDIQSTVALQDALDTYIDTLKPFIIYGSMAGSITKPRGILTLASSLVGIALEDPTLTTHDQWRWDIISLQPVVADYIHILASYYQSKADTFTSLHALASTVREAELISMSLATWDVDFPASSVVVSDDAVVWSAHVAAWLATDASANPFIFTVSTANNNSVLQAGASVAAPIGKGIFAVACTFVYSYYVMKAVTFNPSGNGDIIFGGFRTSWWTADAYDGVPSSLQHYVSNPRYHLAMMGINVAKQLFDRVSDNYTMTAAEVLYKTGVASSSGASFGPFSNTTCTDEQIASNTRDRTCQCAKGIRTTYVHSVRDYQEGIVSNRTNGYTWTMSTCGVSYSEYIRPPTVPTPIRLSAGAIAGIAAGCSIAVLLVIAAIVGNAFLSGRNNRAAPKDPSQPFAIVFTDIQSSTSLWARAPAAMSEAVDRHHQIMRKALKKNRGYEVKTVGDSFMVAFKEAPDATRFAIDAQVLLHAAEWSPELDAIYLELIAEAEEAETEQQGGMASNAYDSSSLSKHSEHQAENRKYHIYAESMSTTYSFNQSQSGSANFKRIVPVLSGVHLSLPAVYTLTNSRTTHAGSSVAAHVYPAVETRSVQTVTSVVMEPPLASGPSPASSTPWHGLRVRIGVHFGLGDIRKDPVTLGFDYYGTVVNTAARVEGVGHGGQTLVTEAAFNALPSEFAKECKAMFTSLGPQPLRGLDAPIRLYQLVPTVLQSRSFPALRLHIEKETEESSMTATTTVTGTNDTESPEALAGRICASKQFLGMSPDEVMDRYQYFNATFGPTTGKYQTSVIAKLAESWGFEKASKAVSAGKLGSTRLLVTLFAKVTKTYHAGLRANVRRRYQGAAETLSEKSFQQNDVASVWKEDSECEVRHQPPYHQ